MNEMHAFGQDSMSSGSIQPEIRDAAQRWFLRLQSHDWGAAERETFEQWRNTDPVHEIAYRAVEHVWRRSAALDTDPALDDILCQARRLPPESPWVRRAAPALALAACLMLAIGMGYRLWWLPAATVPPMEYTTGVGQQSTFVLEDGSRVVLDTASQLQVRYSSDARQLTLVHGRADFQVSHEPARPFVVHVDGASITATGTRFQVRVAHDEMDTVTLLKGRVVVASNAAKQDKTEQVTLQAGERVAIEADGHLGTPKHLPDTDLASARGWTEGMLVVRGWPLARLVTEMNRYTTTPLRLGDPGLDNLPISGSFKASDQKSFLLALEYGWPIRADRSTPGEIVLRHK